MRYLPRVPRVKPIQAVGLMLTTVGGLVLAWLVLPSENYGVVSPGHAYRSAQPVANLGPLLARCKPATVLNLRGGSDADPWYLAEVETTRRQSITFYDLPMSATRRPTRRELRVLIDTLKSCPLPILIHCKSGADRTGLVSALYLMVREGRTPQQALAEFSFRYGHVPLWGPEKLHEPIQEYAAWLETQALPHTPTRFREWVAQSYRAADVHSEQPVLMPGPRVRAARDATIRR